MAAARKGLRNQLKTLLWRTKGSSGSRTLDGPALQAAMAPAYGPGTLEGQMRSLADLAFMLQDYETCASTLRLLGPELKADKAWKHYAGCQVGAGLGDRTAMLPGRIGGSPPYKEGAAWHACDPVHAVSAILFSACCHYMHGVALLGSRLAAALLGGPPTAASHSTRPMPACRPRPACRRCWALQKPCWRPLCQRWWATSGRPSSATAC